MPNVGNAYVGVHADLKPLNKGLNEAHSRVRSNAARLASRLAIPLTIVGTAAAMAGIKLIKDSVKAASDLQEVTDVLPEETAIVQGADDRGHAGGTIAGGRVVVQLLYVPPTFLR